MIQTPFISALVVAAGTSQRMKGINKLFVPLNGLATLGHTINHLKESNYIKEIIIVCRPEDEKDIRLLCESFLPPLHFSLTAGGKTRQQSVERGLTALNPLCQYIAIHDGARPLITKEDINLCIQGALDHEAATLGVPVKDTIKVTNSDHFIQSTPLRENLVAVYTPQVFHLPLYKKALAKAKEEGKNYTDDCQLVEALGHPVLVVAGREDNLKLTTPEDVIILEALLKKREEDLLCSSE